MKSEASHTKQNELIIMMIKRILDRKHCIRLLYSRNVKQQQQQKCLSLLWRQQQKCWITTVRIGNVERTINDSDNNLTIEQRMKIPRGYLEDITTYDKYNAIIHLQWMLQKDILQQDWLLIGNSNTTILRRRLLYAYAELTHRPIEILTLSHDTTEADLKQRRILVNNNNPKTTTTITDSTTTTEQQQQQQQQQQSTLSEIHFIDQAPVRAAINGHLLILDGLHNVERNVLPTINNLLENREMPLEDGRLLVSYDRYQSLINNNNNNIDWIVPVHTDFRIAALYTPSYNNNKLDPPVRSRFQLRRIDPQDNTVILSQLLSISSNQQQQQHEESTEKSISKILTIFASTMEDAISNNNNDSMLLSKDRIHFPVTTTLSGIQTLYEKFSKQSLRSLLVRAYPYFNNEIFERVCNELELPSKYEQEDENDSTFYNVTKTRIIENDPFHIEVDFTLTNNKYGNNNNNNKSSLWNFGIKKVDDNDNNNNVVTMTVPSGGKKPIDMMASSSKSSSFVSTKGAHNVITAMMQEHSINRDILLIAPKGGGKTAITEYFATITGYDIHLFPLYKDMTATELLIRHNNNIESPLVKAARLGQICVLDGIEKISTDALVTIQGLLTDRDMILPDGTKFAIQDKLHNNNIHSSEKSSVNNNNNIIHPSFRVIALASTNKNNMKSNKSNTSSWLTGDVISMFSTIYVPSPSRECLEDILRSVNTYNDHDFKKLLNFYEILLKNDYDCGNITPLSIRTLLRLVKQGGTNDLYNGICNALLADLLTPNQRATLEQMLRNAGIRSNNNYHNNTSSSVMMNNNKRKKKGVHNNTPIVSIVKDEVIIDDFSMKRQLATNTELVPSPYFFDIPNQIRLIRTLLCEWKFGERAFLLIGNQGTGKNKICDRLCQLANFEREYMQLHRDSTIGQLTLSPSLENGRIIWKDSPLVRAVKYGRALIIDEADKAPLEVIAVLKSLVEDAELLLADGRRILQRKLDNSIEDDTIPIHPDFTVWVLANRPGRLFHGHDFFSEIGDCFSSFVVPNPDFDSEIRLLQSYAPNVNDTIIRRIAASFDELRHLFEHGDIGYPYSTREAVAVVKHLNKFPNDDIVTVLHNVLDLDSFDRNTYSVLAEVFRNHDFPFENYNSWKKKVLDSQRSKDLSIHYTTDRTKEGNSTPPPLSSPKVGKWDDKNEVHVGGNQWAGGTGGSDTAGLGGRGGPYRLDRGHKVHQVSDEAKQQVSEEAKAAARSIARKALEERLEEIGMSEAEYDTYQRFLAPIENDIANLRSALQSVDIKTSERGWATRQLEGELDDARLVEGVAGDKHVYKRRATLEPNRKNSSSKSSMRLRFVVDCSGSMYRFNGYDQRLNRCLQAAALVMESFEGLEEKFNYSIVGHSGDSRSIGLVDFGDPPKNALDRLRILQTMVAHSQFCQSGDNTLGAIKKAVKDVEALVEIDDDDMNTNSIVIAISDANLERYGISPRELARAMQTPDGQTKAFCIFIASFGDEAKQIKDELPLGRAFVCMDSGELPTIVRNILTNELE